MDTSDSDNAVSLMKRLARSLLAVTVTAGVRQAVLYLTGIARRKRAAVYQLPTFNLLADIYTSAGWTPPGPPPFGPRVAAVPCNLAWGKRVSQFSAGSTGGTSLVQTMTLLLPAGTDVRGPQDVGVPDVVECPAGSGRWYAVVGVDDIGKGFGNEHRAAVCLAYESSWVPPYA